MSDSKDYELFHYGVKGMKWGVRRQDTDGDGRVNGKGSKSSDESKEPKQSKDSQRAAKLGSKNPSTLSNDQLKELNKRLELEANYKRLTESGTKEKGLLDRGHDQLRKYMQYGQTAITLYNMLNHPATKAGIKFVGSMVTKGVGSTSGADPMLRKLDGV